MAGQKIALPELEFTNRQIKNLHGKIATKLNWKLHKKNMGLKIWTIAVAPSKWINRPLSL